MRKISRIPLLTLERSALNKKWQSCLDKNRVKGPFGIMQLTELNLLLKSFKSVVNQRYKWVCGFKSYESLDTQWKPTPTLKCIDLSPHRNLRGGCMIMETLLIMLKLTKSLFKHWKLQTANRNKTVRSSKWLRL